MASGRGGIGTRTILRTFVRLVLFLGLGFAAGLFFGVVTEEPGLLAGHLQGETQRYALGSDAEPRTQTDDSAANGQPRASAEAGRSRSILGERTAGMQAGRASEGPLETARRIEAERAPRAEPPSGLPDVAARPRSADPVAPAELLPSIPPPSPPRSRPPTRPPAPPPLPPAADPVEAGAADAWAIQVGAFSDRSAAAGLVESLRGKRYPAELIPSSDGSDRWRVRIQPIEGRGEAEQWAFRLKRDERLPTWLIPFEAREPR